MTLNIVQKEQCFLRDVKQTKGFSAIPGCSVEKYSRNETGKEQKGVDW